MPSLILLGQLGMLQMYEEAWPMKHKTTVKSFKEHEISNAIAGPAKAVFEKSESLANNKSSDEYYSMMISRDSITNINFTLHCHFVEHVCISTSYVYKIPFHKFAL